jgi:hypothetical protein
VVLWILLTVLIAFLIYVAVLLFVGANLGSPDKITGEQEKYLWPFLGVAFGVVATLVGALVTNEHNRRTHLLAERSKLQEQQLARETAERLKIDTVTKVLELVTVGGGYAPKARVAGAVATLMELHSDAVSVRILGELWAADAIDSSTAVWLIDCALGNELVKDDETSQAAMTLALQVKRLVPSPEDEHQEWFHWPSTLVEAWPCRLSFSTRNALIWAVTKVLLVRELDWWKAGALRSPVRTLVNALQDPELGPAAALILKALLDRGALDTTRLSEEEIQWIEEKATSVELTGWFDTVIQQLRAWASGQKPAASVTPVDVLGSSPIINTTPSAEEGS